MSGQSQLLMFVLLCLWSTGQIQIQSLTTSKKLWRSKFELWSPELAVTSTHVHIEKEKSRRQTLSSSCNLRLGVPFLLALDSRSSYFCPFTPTSTLLSTNPSTRLSSFNEIPLTIANWHEKISHPQRPLSSFYEFSRIDLMWIWGLPRDLYEKNN